MDEKRNLFARLFGLRKKREAQEPSQPPNDHEAVSLEVRQAGPRPHGSPGPPETVSRPPSPGIRIMPKGNVSVVTLEEVRTVNPYLAEHGRCPRCRSRNLLWYQYGSKRVESGSPVHMRCQDCRWDDYTEL